MADQSIEVDPVLPQHLMEIATPPVATPEGILLPPLGDATPAGTLIRELLDNGQALLHGGSVLVPHSEAAALPAADRHLLDFPPPYPFDLRVSTDGALGQPTVQFRLEALTFEEGERLVTSRTGCFLTAAGEPYTLSVAALALFAHTDRFNANPPLALAEQLIAVARLQELAEAAGASLHPTLAETEVVAPEAITFDIQADEDGVTVAPAIDEVPALPQQFERFPVVRPVYNFSGPDRKRKRVAFSEPQRKQLETAKRLKNVTGEERDRLLEHPESFFDPDLVDLDAFSARVVELGAYRPRFYPFVSAYKSEWTPGFVVETSPGDRRRVTFETEEEAASFGEVVEDAVEAEKPTVTWEGTEIPTGVAKGIAATARRQFEDRTKPAKEEAKEERVLIIKENVEDVDFGETGLGAAEVEHIYAEPPHLRDGVRPRKHQEVGIAWLQSLSADHPGALLADDMGLGKTFTVLAFLKWYSAQPENGGKPYLVVAPVSLLENWESEVDRFFEPSPPEVTRLYGSALKSMAKDAGGDPRALARDLQRSHLCLTTYETLRRQQLAFAAVDWAVVVLDEAQRIKTPGTLVTNAAKALKADFKVAMTGTPVENSLVDLWCIVDFLVPGLLGGAKEFAKDYQKRLDDPETDVFALGQELRARLGDYLKRRLKRDVLGELPQKHSHVCPREMPPEQRERYLVEVDAAQEARRDESIPGHEVLRALQAMRSISDHPYLPDRRLDAVPVEDLIRTSAKLLETVVILDDVRDRGEKVLLFAERRETQRMLAAVLRERYGVHARTINGDTPSTPTGRRSAKLSRQQTIDAFESADGFNALILSPVAAGVGLNITAANHVVHYARHWNPAKEDQATDRAYRIGQTRDVHVYYPMAVLPEFDSFDIVLDRLLERKRALANASLFPTERVEVRRDELYDSVFGGGQAERRSAPLTLEDADALAPHAFEALIAALWAAGGADVVLTPAAHDRGADVAALSGDSGTLIQVKQSGGTVGVQAVQEIVAARPFYQQYLDAPLDLAVVTNGSLTQAACRLAAENDVRVFSRTDLKELILSYPVTIADLSTRERQRLKTLS